MKKSFEQVVAEHLEFTTETFPLATSLGALIHGHREIDEIRWNIENGIDNSVTKTEYADVLGCIFDSANREGISFDEIMWAFYTKVQVNKKRKWKYNGDGSYSHIKDAL